MNTPITAEYCLEKVKEALETKDYKKLEKWDFLLKSCNDLRVRAKQRERAKRNELLGYALEESYRSALNKH